MNEALEQAPPGGTDIEPGEAWGFKPPSRGGEP
jgi:hypothetical protein